MKESGPVGGARAGSTPSLDPPLFNILNKYLDIQCVMMINLGQSYMHLCIISLALPILGLVDSHV